MTFTRPFDTGYAKYMQLLNVSESYKTVINFGIFNNENDTSTQHVYGITKQEDIQNIILL